MLILEEKQCVTAVLCLYCDTVKEHPLSGVVRVQLGKLKDGNKKKSLWQADESIPCTFADSD
jgi:hypothetical protein